MNNKTRIILWISKTFLPPRIMLKSIFGVKLLYAPILGKIIFFLGSLCSIHVCPTKSYDGWITRRWCEKCQDYEDMG